MAMGLLPQDPVAFVAAAEDAINHYDLEATAGLYADAALLHSVTDGAEEHFEGADAIRTAWAGYLEGMRSTGFQLSKTLVSADGETLVNSYESSFRDGRSGRGIETWRFDSEGRVVDHHMYSFFEVRPSGSLVQRLRLLMMYPRIGLAFLRATRRSG
jgi:ketosteroid isomerase-like protein